jgi:serine/threonine-protein kinase
LTKKAFQARQAGRLAEAADLMEEAFNKSPELRPKYARQVKLWRCGISM